MQSFTAITPARLTLPPDLALLTAPVRAHEPSAPDEYVGRAEGVVLDPEGHVVAFVVRLAQRLVAKSPRTLVAANAIEVTSGPVLHLAWTEDQLLAQPQLDENFQPHNRVDGGAPVESQWMPARPNVIPPGEGMNGKEAAKEGLEGGAIGAVIGAVAGMAIGGPIGAIALGAFCAAGGGLAGVLSGVTQETSAEAGEMKFDNVAPAGNASSVALQQLEERLCDPMVSAQGLVHGTRFTPMTTTESRPEESATPPTGAANAA